MKNFGISDQLNSEHSWFKQIDHDTVLCLQKCVRKQTMLSITFKSGRVFFLSFAIKGHQAVYFQINANSNPNDLAKIINSCIEKYNIEKI
jgi:thiamine transporter ThiT